MYQNYNNYHNPLEDHLKEQAALNKSKSQSKLIVVFVFGFLAGVIVYYLYQNWEHEEEIPI